MATKTRAIRLNNGQTGDNLITYVPVTNSDVVQYGSQSISVTTAIQTLVAGMEQTFVDGNSSKAVLHVAPISGTEKTYTFEGKSAAVANDATVVVSYANSKITISATYTDTNTAKATVTAKNSQNVTYTYISPTGDKDTTNGSEIGFKQGSNITLTPNTTAKVIEIAATDAKVTASSNATTKLYTLGVTNTTNQSPAYDPDVFITTNAGDFSAKYYTYSTASGDKALYVDSAKRIHESTVTAKELGYLSGASSNIQTQIDNISSSISSGVTFEGVWTTSTLPTLPSNSGKMYTYTGTGTCKLTSSNSITGEDEILRKGDAIISVYNGSSYVWAPIDNNADIAGTNKLGLVTPGTGDTNGPNMGVDVNGTSGAMTVTHYTPAADANSKIEKDASASSTTTLGTGGSNVVSGVNIERDANGHVTNMTLDSVKLAVDHTKVSGNMTAGRLTQWTGNTVHGQVSTSYGTNTADNIQLHYVDTGVLKTNTASVGSGSVPAYVNAGKLQKVTSIDSSLYTNDANHILGNSTVATHTGANQTTPYLKIWSAQSNGTAIKIEGANNITVKSEDTGTTLKIYGPVIDTTAKLAYTTFSTEVPDLDSTFLANLGTESSATPILTNLSISAHS